MKKITFIWLKYVFWLPKSKYLEHKEFIVGRFFPSYYYDCFFILALPMAPSTWIVRVFYSKCFRVRLLLCSLLLSFSVRHICMHRHTVTSIEWAMTQNFPFTAVDDRNSALLIKSTWKFSFWRSTPTHTTISFLLKWPRHSSSTNDFSSSSELFLLAKYCDGLHTNCRYIIDHLGYVFIATTRRRTKNEEKRYLNTVL